MGLTPNYALPYPELTDTADVPRDVRALADKLDALPGLAPSAPIPMVTALPGAPVEGQEVYYQTQAMALAGVGPWHLRYRAINPDASANANTHKWDVLGGNPWRHAIATDQAVGSNGVWADLGTIGPIVTLPLGGVYLAQAGCDAFTNGVAQQMMMGITIGATSPVVGNSRTAWSGAMAQRQTINVETELSVAAGQDIRMRHWANGGSGQFATFGRRFLSVTPLRVG